MYTKPLAMAPFVAKKYGKVAIFYFLFVTAIAVTYSILDYTLGHKSVISSYIIELYNKILSNYKVDQNPQKVIWTN